MWRDGQQRRVYVYRFMTTGTIEEKVYQRQLSKEGLQAVVDSKAAAGAAESNLMSLEELRDLFSYDPATLSTTYDHMVAGKKRKKRKSKRRGGGDKHGKGGDSEVSDADEDDFKGDSESEEEEEEDEDAVESDQETVGEAGDTAGGIKLQKSADVVAAGGRILTEQAPDPKEDDLATWAHHSDPTTVPDQVMKLTGGEEVTFVFSCKVDGREVPDDAPLVPFGQAERPINHAGAGLGPKAVSVGPRRGAVGVSSLRPGAASAPGPGVQAGAVVRKALVARKTPPLPKSLTASAPPRPRVTPPSASGKDAANGKENAEDVVDLTKSTPKQPLQKAKGATPVLTKPEAAVSAPKRPPVSVSAPPTKPKAPTAAGSKRRFSAGAVAAEAAAAGASKRTAVLYDSDDDFV